VVVATSEDSQERFQARKMWPAYAKWLREVGPSVPVVSSVINAADKEALLSEQYGGRSGDAPGVSVTQSAKQLCCASIISRKAVWWVL
jgi:hypothetical protein